MTRHLRRALLVCGWSFAWGCKVAPYPALERELQSSELVGTWGITDASLRDYEAERFSRYATREAHHLTLSADGSCLAKTLLGGHTLGQRVDPQMRCRWSLVADQGSARLTLEVTVRDDLRVNEKYEVAEESGQLLLWAYLDQPQERRFAVFEKVS